MSESLPPYLGSEVTNPYSQILKEKVDNMTDRFIYRPRIFSACAALGLTLTAIGLVGVDSSPTTPDFLQGRLFDVVGTTANAAFNRAILNDGTNGLREIFVNTRFERQGERVEEIMKKHPYLFSALSAFTGQAFWEVGQKFGLFPGTYDPGDFIAYGVGILGWVALNKSASYIYGRYVSAL